MWPFISGKSATSPRIDVPVSYNTLISRDYKILVGTVDQAGWTGPQYPNTSHLQDGISASEDCGDTGCLYNIKMDPEEHNNLASEDPQRLSDMRDKLATYQETYFNPDRGKEWPGACETAMNEYGGFWGPFLP